MSNEQVQHSFIKGQENFVNTTGLRVPFKYMSTSQVTSYLLCPMAYYWKYIEGKREPKNAKMVAGIVAHKVVELLAELDQLDYSDAELEANFHQIFNDTIEDMPMEEKTGDAGKELHSEKDKILHSVKMYCQTEFKRLNVIGQEIQINKDIDIIQKVVTTRGNVGHENMGKLTFVGFIDFVNHIKKNPEKKLKNVTINDLGDPKEFKFFELGDYKTGAAKDHTFFMSDMQTPFYNYATGISNIRIDNIVPARIKYNKNGSPRKDNVPPSYHILKYKPSAENIKDMLDQFSAAAVGIGMGAFPMCHPTMWKCNPNNCGHWSYCRGKHKEDTYLKKVAHEKHQDLKYKG